MSKADYSISIIPPNTTQRARLDVPSMSQSCRTKFSGAVSIVTKVQRPALIGRPFLPDDRARAQELRLV